MSNDLQREIDSRKKIASTIKTELARSYERSIPKGKYVLPVGDICRPKGLAKTF